MKEATETQLESVAETTVAARIAGEDIACGDFVTVLNEIVELPSFLWDCTAFSLAPDEPVRLNYVPANAGEPFKVVGVCLPFVYVKNHSGAIVVMDTRRRRLARLDRDCARTVWKQMKPSRKRLLE